MLLSNPSFPELKSDFRALCRFFVPVLLMSFVGNLTPFIEKILFGHVSPETLTISVDVNLITRIFQITFVYLASLTQVYVGQWYGAGEYFKIGKGVWQLIWLAIFSMLITLPIGLWIGNRYFQHSGMANLARPYLYTYLGMNFLFPLRATLTGFYLGRSKATWVTSWTIVGEFLQLMLSSILIIGIPGWVPSLGLMGGAISHLIIQSSLCFFLFIHFMSASSHHLYRTKSWRWQPQLFWELIKPGFSRVITQVLQAPSWAAISYLMTKLGSSYASVLSVGITLFYFLACIGNAIQSVMMSLNAQLIGAKAHDLIKKSMRNGYLLIFLAFMTIGIPMLLFSESIYRLLFPRVLLEPALVQVLPKFIWMCLVTGAISSILSGTLLAFKDTRFLVVAGLWSLLYDLGICAYLAMTILRVSPAYFWLLISLGHLMICFVYYRRIQWLQSERLKNLGLSEEQV